MGAGRAVGYHRQVAVARPTAFGELLRYWRRARKRSQLDLALEAQVSARHLSFVETGRSRPSRDMVLRFAEVLDLPLRERNAMLNAAGYASVFSEAGLDAEEMAAVRRSLEFLLERHEPHPAVVLDRHWTAQLRNRAAGAVLAHFVASPDILSAPLNLVRLLFSPGGVRPSIVNWRELAGAMIQRLHREAALDPSDQELAALLDEALAAGDVPADWRAHDHAARPPVLLEMRLRRGDLELGLFSAITTLGTPLDVTLQGLRLETFFPVDEDSARTLRALAGA